MKLSSLQVLSASEIRMIHDASMDILTTCGVKLGSREMLSALREKGLPVDEEAQIVRFPRPRVEEAIAQIPPRFDVFNREGRFAFTMGDGQSKIAAGHNAVFWVDSGSGETRPSTVDDVEKFSRICDRLEGIDMIGIPVMPQDVPVPEATLMYAVRAVAENSAKPIFFSTDNARINRNVIKMLDAAFAGELAHRIYGVCQLSPTSPLYWERGVLEALMETIQTGVPIAVLPEPNAGVSAPYTLAGLLTVNNTECLSGLTMIETLKPGAPVMYANSWTATDMRTGMALVGSAETTLCRVAGAQLARHYGVPSHTTAPNSDNHAHDEQNAWEKSFSVFCSVAAGNDLIVNCGMFATGMTCSHEQLIMDEEMSAISRRLAAGIKVDDDTIAAELIKHTGHRGSYLMADHTLKWLRSEEYLEPRISVRESRAVWENSGAMDTYRIAREKAIELAEPGAAAPDQRRQQALADVLSAFERDK